MDYLDVTLSHLSMKNPIIRSLENGASLHEIESLVSKNPTFFEKSDYRPVPRIVAVVCTQLVSLSEEYRKILLYLLNRPDIDPNEPSKFGTPALHNAIQNRNIPVLTLMTSHPRVNINVTNQKGETALKVALRDPKYWQYHAHLLLTRPEINVTQVDFQGNSALHVAARSQSDRWYPWQEIFELLFQRADLNVNQPNKKGETAFHLAVKKNGIQLVKYFLHQGLHFNLKNLRGETPLMQAQRLGLTQISNELAQIYPSILLRDHPLILASVLFG
tara:strand:- start:270 stop:1091 length:822 start_codon:yes stop_codon:yes gene_type:complete